MGRKEVKKGGSHRLGAEQPFSSLRTTSEQNSHCGRAAKAACAAFVDTVFKMC